MKTIAIIEKNSCRFDRLEEFVGPLLYRKLDINVIKELKVALNNYLWSVIEPYVTFIDVDLNLNSNDGNENFITVATQSMTKNFPDNNNYDDFFYHTEASYSFPKKYIELMHCQPLWSGYQRNQIENINSLGCLFSLKHTVIENTCIIIANKYDLEAAHFAVIDCVTKEDILRVIRRRFFFSAVLIKDNQLVKYYYQKPRYLVQVIYGLTENDKIEKLAFSHLKYNLLCYFQHDKTKQVNQIATRINGLYRLYGDVLLLHEMEDDIYANISIHEVKRINVLSYGKLSDRMLKKEEVHDITTIVADDEGKEKQNKVTPFWSRYIVINNRMLEWQTNKNRCINCLVSVEKPITCDKCYRAKYCSEKCMKEYSVCHADECINPQSYNN